MTTRQLVEIECDCAKDCPGSHTADTSCPEVKHIQTNSMITARWTALVSDAWTLDTEPRNGYGGRPPGRKPIGDRCRWCADWGDVEAVVRDTLDALGLLNEANLTNALTEVRRVLGLPSGP